MKNWEIIADNLGKAGWSWGCASTTNRQTIFVADAFLDLERAIRVGGEFP